MVADWQGYFTHDFAHNAYNAQTTFLVKKKCWRADLAVVFLFHCGGFYASARSFNCFNILEQLREFWRPCLRHCAQLISSQFCSEMIVTLKLKTYKKVL